MTDLKIYAWAYLEERFGRKIVRLSGDPVEGAMPLVLKETAELQIAAALSQAEANRVDAERYRWLRDQDWFDGELCVLRNPKEVLTSGSGLGADCPSHSRLDEAIDARIIKEHP